MKKKISDEQLLNIINADIQRANQYYENHIKPRVEQNIQLYKGDENYYKKLMPEISKKSRFVSTDIADVVEAIMAQLMKIFFGSQEVITIQGRTAEDEEPARILQMLCNYQINRLNDGFMKFYRWFKDALYKDFGVMKITWDRQYETDEYDDTLSIDELNALQANPNVRILETENLGEQPDANGLLKEIYRVKYELKRVIKNQPVFEVVPYYEFLFDPTAINQNDMRFAIHRKLVTVDYLRKKQDDGIYKNVDEAIQAGNTDDNFFIDNIENMNKGMQMAVNSGNDENKARQFVTLYEYWGQVDIDGDGRLENVVCTVVNNTIISLQENTLGAIPFAILSPMIENDSPIGKGFASMLAQIQNMKTMLIKELAYNVALANDGRMLINQDFVNINDLFGNAKYIRTKGNMPLQQIAMPIPLGNIHQATFTALEYFDTIKENRSGITRYNQGLDARSLNRTATGVSLIMQASTQRLELIARVFAETGIKRFYRLLVGYNLRFIDEEQVIRLTNHPLEIRDDFDGKFDYIVNAGVGISHKQETLEQLQQLLQIQTQILMPLKLVEPQHIWNTVAKMLEITGFKDVERYMVNINNYLQQQQLQQQTQGGVNGQGADTGVNQQISQGQVNAGAPESTQGNAGAMSPEALQQLASMLGGGMGTNQGGA